MVSDITSEIIPVSDDLDSYASILRGAETLHRSLRPDLPDDYVAYMQQMFSEGAEMAVLMVDGKAKAIAVYRSFHTTFHGYRFYIDDLVTDAVERSRGYGRCLLAWCEARARERGCDVLALDSGVQRTEAHRFYFRERLSIFAFSFMKLLG
ncbi:GNAT family N-acetyltransferase [Acetobacteraceae bacterium ESL0709]|nr:GNAT family N-acetyltransferase [Acetobacteraceae bacterium ESL0697]MDF7678555.1 GNAT family N-acetyltransferase [Acetobacteraceae bacterium ESL0709]